MLSSSIIREVEARERTLHARIREAYRQRHYGLAEGQIWETACREWHSYRHPIDELWSDEFRQSLKAGGREAVEDAILYLEVDPWYFRSGYLKEKLLKGLRQAPLTSHDQDRLRGVILKVAAGVNRREFRNYCQLAARLVDSEFLSILNGKSQEQDLQVKGKFSYLRGFLESVVGQSDRLVCDESR